MQIASASAQKRDYEFQLRNAQERENKLSEVLDYKGKSFKSGYRVY